MHNLVVGFILMVAVVSGTSKPLLILASSLIFVFSIWRLPQSGYVVRVNHVKAIGASFFLLFLVLSAITVPIENIPKLVMTLTACILAGLIIGYVCVQSRVSRIRIYALVLGLILVGDLIHLSGFLGGDMNLYKHLVQFEVLSDLDRESDVGILGLRYHGWFAEPSYHGAFTGLLCAQLWNASEIRWRVILVAAVLFLLCPTPMMVLAFVVGATMGMRNIFHVVARHPFVSTFVLLLFATLVSVLFASRFAALATGAADAMGGELVNSSEAIRLVYPLIALFTHFSSYGFLPESSSCIERATCLPESLKFPLITYLIFFGIAGVVVIVMFTQWLYRSSAMRVLLAIGLASILSGGGGYVLQFGLIVAMLLNMTVVERAHSPFVDISKSARSNELA